MDSRSDDMRRITRAIRAIMTIRNITRDELAEKIGILPRTLENKMLRGTMSAVELVAIMEALGAELWTVGDDYKITINL